jgi:hypothetical protein
MAGPDDDRTLESELAPTLDVGATQQRAQRGDASSFSELYVRLGPSRSATEERWPRLRARLAEKTWPRGLLDD